MLGVGAGGGALASTVGALRDGPRAVVLEQGDRCVEVTALSGEVPVEELYDYRYPTNLFGGTDGSIGTTYSSEGTTDLQRDATSVLFLYDGPEGLSLLAVHGRLDGDDDGGVVTFALEGVPDDATWVVRDDYYLEDGEQADSNFDRWGDGDDSDVQVVDWAYKGGRTDGGALRGLGESFEVTVDPAFNDAARLSEDHPSFGPIEHWEALSGSRESPERLSLRMDRPVTIRTGVCDGEEVDSGAEESDPESGRDDPADEGTADDQATEESGTGDGAKSETDSGTSNGTTDEDESDAGSGGDGTPGNGRGHGRGRGGERGKGRGHRKDNGRGHENGDGRGHEKHG